MDRLDAMAVFVAVVDAGSLSAAGRRLSVPLATVSRKLADLEAHLEARLLLRATRRFTLTDAGRDYLAACRRILAEVSAAELDAAGEYAAPRGDLVVTAPVEFGRLHVLPVVADFLAAYPEVFVRLVLGDAVSDLLNEPVDVAVRIGELPDSALVATCVGSTRRVVAGSPGYFERRGEPAHPHELAAHDCVSFEALTPHRDWAFRIDGAIHTVPLRARLAVNTAEAAVDAAVAGVGLTRVLGYQMARAEAAGLLRATLASFELAPLPVHLVHAHQTPLPLKLRAFLDFTAPRLRERLAAASRAP